MTNALLAILAIALVCCVWLALRGQRLRRRAELFHKAFETSPAAIAVTAAATGRLLEVNQSFEQLFQYPRSELLGRTTRELGIWLSPDERDTVLRQADAEGRVRDRPIVFRRRDGEHLHILFSSERVVIDGEAALLSTLRDVTEQVRAANQKDRIDAQVQETRRLEAIGQLAGGIAHDFNNVLQAVKGYTELAADSLPPGHPVQAQLAQVDEAANRAATFTAQLLTFSRRDAPRTETLDVNQIALETSELLRRTIGGHIRLAIRPGDAVPAVEGDRGQVEQVLTSLCLNAREAMPNGGTMTIETGRAVLSESDCAASPWAREGSWAYVRVSDQGAGIPDDIRPRIFEPFFTTKAAGRGAGLGLSTVYAIVERHRGLIAVDTRAGRGTTFTVYLPDAGTRAAGDEAARPAAAASGGGETILLAEDEPVVRELAVEMLESAGYRVFAASDGGEAESIAADRGNQIDAAILDIVMPVRNGRQVFDALRRSHPGIPVVFCSGYSFGELRDVERLAGASILPKPYGRAALLAAVRSAIDSRRTLPTQ